MGDSGKKKNRAVLQGWWNSSVDKSKGPFCLTLSLSIKLELDSWNPHGRRRNLTPEVVFVCAFMYLRIYIIMKCNIKKYWVNTQWNWVFSPGEVATRTGSAAAAGAVGSRKGVSFSLNPHSRMKFHLVLPRGRICFPKFHHWLPWQRHRKCFRAVMESWSTLRSLKHQFWGAGTWGPRTWGPTSLSSWVRACVCVEVFLEDRISEWLKRALGSWDAFQIVRTKLFSQEH